MNLLSKLFEKKQQDKPAPKQQNPRMEEAMYLTATVTYGMHLYRRPDEDSSVYFVDENRGIHKMIIDSQGKIQNFPGFVKEEFWVKQVPPNYLKPQVRFRSSFEKRDHAHVVMVRKELYHQILHHDCKVFQLLQRIMLGHIHITLSYCHKNGHKPYC